MARKPSAVLSLSLSQESWRDAVQSFVAAEKREIFQIEVTVTGSAGQIVALDSWMSGARSALSMAEGIVDWIELRGEIAGARDLEATISVWPKPYETAERVHGEENDSSGAISAPDFQKAYHTRERRFLFNFWRATNNHVSARGLRYRG